MTKYIIVCPKNGKAVQNWSFADRKHIVYCVSPEWAMPFNDEKSANERKEYLEKNFPGQTLTVMKVTIETTYKFG